MGSPLFLSFGTFDIYCDGVSQQHIWELEMYLTRHLGLREHE